MNKGYGKDKEAKYTIQQLKELQSLPLDKKIEITEARILEYVHRLGGSEKVYVSFSGGKDSTVLLHIARRMFPDMEAVFCDTGLEFPEIKTFIKSFDNVTIIKPEMNFKQVIDNYGYPVVSKEVADTVYYAKRNPNSKRYTEKLSGSLNKDGKRSRYNQSKWKYLVDAPFDLNAKCCSIMKKKPFRKFKKINGKNPILGTNASESMLRTRSWLINGCNNYTKYNVKSMPMSIWTEEDVWNYIKEYNIDLAEPYKMGYKRTGCIFCGFGAHLEKGENRFDILKKTHPNLYNYMMKPKEEGGLGMRMPLEYVGVKLKDE